MENFSVVQLPNTVRVFVEGASLVNPIVRVRVRREIPPKTQNAEKRTKTEDTIITLNPLQVQSSPPSTFILRKIFNDDLGRSASATENLGRFVRLILKAEELSKIPATAT